MGLAEKIRDAGLPREVPMDVFIVLSLTEPPLLYLPYPSVADAKRQIAANEGETHGVDGEINAMVSDQDRLRQNINSLNQVNGQQQQVQNYARILAEQESQLATLRDKAAGLRRAHTGLTSQLNSAIEKMEF
jgi:hypothetical protein